jgi:PAS domain S-box-containing protein
MDMDRAAQAAVRGPALRRRSGALRGSDNVAERSPDKGVLMLDHDGRVVWSNQRAERMLGMAPGGLRGRSCLWLLAQPNVDDRRRNRALETALSSGSYETHGWRWRADGSRFWASVTLRPVRDQTSGGFGFVAVVRDLTEKRRRADELRGALEISRAILAGQPPGAVLQLVAGRGRQLVEGDCALVRTPGAGGNVLVLRAAAWRHPNDALLVAPAREVLRGGSITGWVFDTGRPRLVTGRPRTARTQVRSERAWPDASPGLYVPLNALGRTLGTLVVMNWRSRRGFRRQDLDVLQVLANRAALGIHHASVNRDRERMAVAEERARLGRELHDGAIQSLYAVTLDLAGTIARTADHGLQEQLAGMTGRIDAVIQGLRAHIDRLRRDLNPSSLEESS